MERGLAVGLLVDYSFQFLLLDDNGLLEVRNHTVLIFVSLGPYVIHNA